MHDVTPLFIAALIAFALRKDIAAGLRKFHREVFWEKYVR